MGSICAKSGVDEGKSKWVKLFASTASPKLAMSTIKGEKTKPTHVMPTVSKVKPKHAESRTEGGGSRWMKSQTKVDYQVERSSCQKFGCCTGGKKRSSIQQLNKTCVEKHVKIKIKIVDTEIECFHVDMCTHA